MIFCIILAHLAPHLILTEKHINIHTINQAHIHFLHFTFIAAILTFSSD